MFKNKLLLFYLSLSLNVIAQSQIPTKCDLTIEHNAVTLVGNVLYLDLKLINRSDHAIDNIKFSVSYYNIYNEFIATKKYIWETGYLIETLKPHTWTKYYRPAYINSDETVKRYTLTIDRIHFTDGTICDDSYVSYKETQRLNETSLKKLWVAKTKMDSSKAVAKIINEKNNPTYIEPSKTDKTSTSTPNQKDDNNIQPLGSPTDYNFKDKNTLGNKVKNCNLNKDGTIRDFKDIGKGNTMPGFEYGCQCQALSELKKMLHYSDINDGVYGDDLLHKLMDTTAITPEQESQAISDHKLLINQKIIDDVKILNPSWKIR